MYIYATYPPNATADNKNRLKNQTSNRRFMGIFWGSGARFDETLRGKSFSFVGNISTNILPFASVYNYNIAHKSKEWIYEKNCIYFGDYGCYTSDGR
ncbi:MAG: hypothetical protein II208_04210, partial [Alphaproteobacteria bacterium]|nr:hypothetical protein [Alphaproteobacteria bacterium]